MFTGLIEHSGAIAAVDENADGAVIEITTDLAPTLSLGDSVAVNGVCLTATRLTDASFSADVMHESLKRTALGALGEGDKVNLELPLAVGDRLDGHIVQGHVDGVGRVSAVAPDGFAQRVTIEAPAQVLRYVVHKGSITVDGVSLTVAELDDRSFTVSLIPETLERTNLGHAQPGTVVNLEVDVLAKYVERLMSR